MPAEETAVIPLEPFLVNLADKDASRFLRVSLQLVIDSKELGVHTFDFADIKEIRSSRVVQVGFADASRPPAMGRLVLEGTNARVIAESGATAFGRPEILTIVVGSA